MAYDLVMIYMLWSYENVVDHKLGVTCSSHLPSLVIRGEELDPADSVKCSSVQAARNHSAFIFSC